MKALIHRLVLIAERLLDTVRRAPRANTPLFIQPYLGYASTDAVILRGRVLSRDTASQVHERQSMLRNLAQMVKLFLTDEVADVELRCRGQKTTSDEEGYFQFELPRNETSGWHAAPVELGAGETALCPYYVAPHDASFLIVSDIDDTVLKTGAWTLWRNLWTTFTSNSHTRQVHADAVELFAELKGAHDLPIYYVSSSPWNLHGFLQQIFERTGLPRGPIFLRDLGVDDTKFIIAGHGSHKVESIDTILAAHPGLQAVLVGDTGQKDAAIYRDVIKRHRGGVAAVVLRAPGPGLDDADRPDLKELNATGVPVFVGRDFSAFRQDLSTLIATASKRKAIQ